MPTGEFDRVPCRFSVRTRRGPRCIESIPTSFRAAHRRLYRQQGQRYISARYDCFGPVVNYRDHFSAFPFSSGPHFWYKAECGLWWVRKLSSNLTGRLHLIDGPHLVYTMTLVDVAGSWFLKIHKEVSFVRVTVFSARLYLCVCNFFGSFIVSIACAVPARGSTVSELALLWYLFVNALRVHFILVFL